MEIVLAVRTGTDPQVGAVGEDLRIAGGSAAIALAGLLMSNGCCAG